MTSPTRHALVLGAGLAGAIEVAAVHTAANASLIAGLGYTGILVSFVARHNPWAIVPVAWTLFDRDRQFLYDRLSGCALVMA